MAPNPKTPYSGYMYNYPTAPPPPNQYQGQMYNYPGGVKPVTPKKPTVVKPVPPIVGTGYRPNTSSFTGIPGTAYGPKPTPAAKKPPYTGTYTPHTNSFTGIPGTQNPRANQVGITPSTFIPGGVYETGIPAAQQQTVSDPIMDALRAMLNNAGATQVAPVGPISVPELPRTDISGLLGQFSPMINSAFDKLINEIQGRKGEQERSLGEVMNRVRASYAPARADVNAGTQAAGKSLSDFANRLGLQQGLSGGMNQRWAESAGRLNNLATQNQAAQTGALETLQNARNSQFGTMLSSAQGGRASALADLASQLANSQSDIDLARATNQSQLAQAALSGQLDLTKLQAQLGDSSFDRQLSIAKMLTDLQLEREKQAQAAAAANQPDVSQTQTMQNPGLQQDLARITDPNVKRMVQDALSTTSSVDEAYRQLFGKQLSTGPMAPVQEAAKPGGIKGLIGMIGAIPQLSPTSSSFQDMLTQKDALAAAIAFLQAYAPSYGGVGTTTTIKRST